MKEVILLIKGKEIKIFAEGPNGAGTEKFTQELAEALGIIKERHKGPHAHQHHADWRKTLADHRVEQSGGHPPHH